jgi:hypothetical protein
MGLHGRVVVFGALVIEGTDLDDAGVVDQHVDGAKAAGSVGHGALGIRPDADISGDRQHLEVGMVPPKRRRSPFELFGVAGHEGQVGPFGGQLARQHQPQAARAACDDDRAPVKVVGPAAPPSLLSR